MSVKNLLRHVYFLKQKKLKLKFFVNKHYKTILGETGCLGNLYFTYWLPKHLVFWFTLTLTQSVRLPMVTYPSLCSTCVTYGTLCHAIGHQVLPTPASVIPHPSVNYRQVFRPILYFQPSPSQSDSRLYPIHPTLT